MTGSKKGKGRTAPTEPTFGVILGRNYEVSMSEKSAFRKIDGPPL